MNTHPWHGLSAGADAPEVVTAVIEIPRGSKAKYELDKDTGFLKLDRILSSAVHYPANYGFIPKTYCDDKDPLDVLVLCSVDLTPMCLVEARIVGAMHMIDKGEQDDKMIAVANDDPMLAHIKDLDDLSPHLQKEIKNFFESYKKLEKKSVTIERTVHREEALEIVKDSLRMYQEHFSQ